MAIYFDDLPIVIKTLDSEQGFDQNSVGRQALSPYLAEKILTPFRVQVDKDLQSLLFWQSKFHHRSWESDF